jgi:hypothetical protein
MIHLTITIQYIFITCVMHCIFYIYDWQRIISHIGTLYSAPQSVIHLHTTYTIMSIMVLMTVVSRMSIVALMTEKSIKSMMVLMTAMMTLKTSIYVRSLIQVRRTIETTSKRSYHY